MRNQRNELVIFGLVLVAVGLIVAGHFIMKPNYHNVSWVQYSLAILPFALFGLVIVAFKIALKNDDQTDK